MSIRRAKIVFSLSFFLLISFFIQNKTSFGSETDFPSYSAIAGKVAFWEKVFSQYTSSQLVVHDRNNLNIIYEVIQLRKPINFKVALNNRLRIEQTRSRYRRILLKLARSGIASSLEERRVLLLFGNDPPRKLLEAAAENVRMQSGLRDRFRDGIIRAGAHLGEIKEIFGYYGLPEDLVFLAHVESSFNHLARSRAGAVGLWQFIKATGQSYLEIDAAVDERRDPLKSSRAAAEYLLDNYRELGSWPLAITAYNHGMNGIKRAVREKGDFERIIKEYDGKSFGFASRNFYAEFLAARKVAKNYREYFGELPVEKPGRHYSVPLKGFVDARRLAGHLNIDIETIRALNPDLSRAVIRGEEFIPEGYSLRLPDSFAYLSETSEIIPAVVYRTSPNEPSFHQVRQGETVYEIALRNGLEIDELLFANSIDEDGVIFVGQNLRIPRYAGPAIHLTESYKVAIRNDDGRAG